MNDESLMPWQNCRWEPSAHSACTSEWCRKL